MNRAQRRASKKATPSYKRGMTQEDKIKAFYKNGITVEDLERNYREGWKDACDYCMRVCYAASVLALRELEGYHTKRNTRFLRLMDDKVSNALSSDEAIDEAFARAGVRICFNEVMPEERVMPDIPGSGLQ